MREDIYGGILRMAPILLPRGNMALMAKLLNINLNRTCRIYVFAIGIGDNFILC